MPSLVPGRIVWVELTDPRGGNPKCRPAVVLTDAADVPPGEPLIGVAVTTHLPTPLPSDYVQLPWHRNRHPVTSLYAPCAAKCSWLVEFQAHDIQSYAGVLPDAVLHQIIAKVNQFRKP